MTTNWCIRLLRYRMAVDVVRFRKDARQVVRELGFFRSQYGDCGVTCTQAHIMLELASSRPMSLTELIEAVCMDKSTASRTVRRMHGKGWLKQRSDRDDGRVKRFSLTASGRRHLARVDQCATTAADNALANLTPEEQAETTRGMALYAKALVRSRLQRGHEIRPMRRADNRALDVVIRGILEQEFAETPEEIDAMLPECSDLYAHYGRARSAYFVLEGPDGIVGGAGIAPLARAWSSTCELQKMYFLPEARGRGLGSRMLERCLSFAREQGYVRCYLDTRTSMTRAIALYQKHGFRREKRPRGKTGHTICDQFYSREL